MTIKECKQVIAILCITLIMVFGVFWYQDKQSSPKESNQRVESENEDRGITINFNNTLDLGLFSTFLSLMFSVGWGLYKKHKK